MSYLPIRCDACLVVSLVAAKDCRRGEAACPECQAQASVLPGCSYAEHDLGLFEDLRGYLRQAELSDIEVCELAVMMDQLRTTNDPQTFVTLLEYLPALGPALTILTTYPAKLRQALSMLSTLLNDRACARNSGTVELALVRHGT